MTNRKMDTDTQVFFYEQEFYVLSNFSSFMVDIPIPEDYLHQAEYRHMMFPTAEHAYHYFKFRDDPTKRFAIRQASSAHLAFEMAGRWARYVREDWKEVRVDFMRVILRAKVEQHEYVYRKLMETGARELIEDSWRDNFWGWGEERDGENMLGKLWMEIRQELNRR